MSNQTAVLEVTLVGFPGLADAYHDLVSTIMFLTYVISLTTNGAVICLVTFNGRLRQPMYLIIANLAASDLLFDTVTLPKAIARYWFGASTIPLKMCLLQIFLVHYLGSLDSFLLMLMAADRYVAICHPLRYASIITNRVATMSCAVCWMILSSSPNVVNTILASQITLCGSFKVNSLFCGYTAYAASSCTDVSGSRKVGFVNAMVVLLLPLGLILVSYIKIIAVISTNRSESLQKAFYTCVTHLLVIALYYTPRLFVYIISDIPYLTMNFTVNTILLFLYSFIPHMANPVIYFLRNKEIKQTLRRVLDRSKFRARRVF
ncbi:olfactory receptor 1E16-like [Mantella aurantiaca]